MYDWINKWVHSLMSKLKKCGKFCVCVFQVRVDHRAVPDLRFSHGLEVHSYEKGYESSAILGSDSLGALTHNSSGRGGCGRLAPALPVTSAPRIRTQNLDHVSRPPSHPTLRANERGRKEIKSGGWVGGGRGRVSRERERNQTLYHYKALSCHFNEIYFNQNDTQQHFSPS